MALLTTQTIVPGTGSIKGVGVGVYWDLQCKNQTSTLDFGLLEPGSSKNFTLYLKNKGNTLLTLNMTSEEWNPTNATEYLTLTWNREGQQLNVGEVIDFMIMLSVSSNVTGIDSFSMDIVISGTG
jgi:hypothetical protein